MGLDLNSKTSFSRHEIIIDNIIYLLFIGLNFNFSLYFLNDTFMFVF